MIKVDLRVNARLPLNEEDLMKFLKRLDVRVVHRDSPSGSLWLKVDSPHSVAALEYRLRLAGFDADVFGMELYEKARG